MDGSGIIDAVGADVAPRVGQRVWLHRAAWRRPFGSCAQHLALPEDRAVEIPTEVELRAGATLDVPALTAHRAVFGFRSVQPHRAGDRRRRGWGLLCHLTRSWAGSRVIATESGEVKSAEAAGPEPTRWSTTGANVSRRVLDLTFRVGADHLEVNFGTIAVLRDAAKVRCA